MSALVDSLIQTNKKLQIREAVRQAFAAFEPQSINTETIVSEVMASTPNLLLTDVWLTIGDMCGAKEIIFAQEDFTYESSPGIFETEVIIAYRLNKTWNENS